MTRRAGVACAAVAAAVALTAGGEARGVAAAPATAHTAAAGADAGVTLTLGDTGTLSDSDASVTITATLSCQDGYTAFGSVAVSDNASAGDLGQPQGYSGLLRIPCTGQPQALTLTLTSTRTPFREGPALARAGFTLNLCDPACRWVYATATVTNTRPAGAPGVVQRPAPAPHVAPGEGRP